eukprot:scaffold2262_cov262-Pinguiococcus_pyrenoidosus.AAC.15
MVLSACSSTCPALNSSPPHLLQLGDAQPGTSSRLLAGARTQITLDSVLINRGASCATGSATNHSLAAARIRGFLCQSLDREGDSAGGRIDPKSSARQIHAHRLVCCVRQLYAKAAQQAGNDKHHVVLRQQASGALGHAATKRHQRLPQHLSAQHEVLPSLVLAVEAIADEGFSFWIHVRVEVELPRIEAQPRAFDQGHFLPALQLEFRGVDDLAHDHRPACESQGLVYAALEQL